MTAATSTIGSARSPSNDDLAVRATGLVKRYADLTAVDNIDLEVRRGTCVGVLGPNGAGKTTTIEMLEGLKKPDAGEIIVLGRTWAADPRGIQERIGVQLQEAEFQDKLTVFEILRLFRSFFSDGTDINEVMETIGLTEKRDTFVKHLSGGQRQRLSLGCALLNKPEILFLDEPTTGLDPQARRRAWEMIEAFKGNGGTILLTTHYMEEAERLADELVIFDRGKVVARGSPASLKADLGADSFVRFTLADGSRGTLEDSDLTALAGVRSVRREGAAHVLTVVQTQQVIAGLFDLAKERDLLLDDLRTHRPTLEDVFVALTGNTLRDE